MRRLFAVLILSAIAAHAADDVSFSRDILPILSENCFHCHGPDSKTREAGLRMDEELSVKSTREGVIAIVPGKRDASDAWLRITSSDKDDQMPPPKSNRKLTAEQVALIGRWIDEGAKWGKHWAFENPQLPVVPENRKLKSEVRNEIDAFVAARLEKESLAFSPEAAPEKLIRRLTLDLTGLPPTPEEINDHTGKSFESLVDRLLASPRYGERMVWEWLDAARYADTNGYQGDPIRAMWYWRDWAVKALNDNVPFDRFTIEQIAGDLLPQPTQEQLIATGFHRNHMINGEGGRIAEESRVDYVQDRVETTGAVWLGLTLTCCRCHDHKFDPISQREYYQLAAYFNSIEETGGGGNDGQGLANPTISLASPEQQKKVEELRAAEAAAQKERDEIGGKLREQQPDWEKAMLAAGGKPGEPVWHALTPEELYADHGTTLAKLDDGSVLASGANPAKESIVFIAKPKIGKITGFKLEMLPHDSLVNKGPGRADNGNFVLTEIALQGDGKPVELGAVSADFIQNDTHKPGTVFDGNLETGWAVMPKFGVAHTLVFESRGGVGYSEAPLLSFRLDCKSGNVAHTLGRFKLYATTDNPILLRPTPEKLRELLAKPADKRSDAEKKELTQLYLDTSADYSKAKDKREQVKRKREVAESAAPRTMVMREREKPRDTFILSRGAYDKPADKVTHGTPAILNPLSADAPKNRLALAQWLVSPENPLTARVIVNRVWQQFFGTGFVKTAEDFGVQSERPSHPELLDWLAVKFRTPAADGGLGWDLKKLVKLIVTSATYRQQSNVPPGLAERDPENRLLARGPRHRWPSWMLRDQALAVSGLLVEKLGGPPVKGYQPDGVWEEATFGQIRYTRDSGDALYRRSLYVFWRRIVGPTMFFDVSNRQQCSVKTGRTNTPLHALATLNDITYVEAARVLAERILKTGGATDAERIAFAHRLCTARAPRENEAATLLAGLTRLRAHYAQDAAAAKKLIATGESKTDPKLDAAELAAHTSLALLLLNLDETLSKE